MDYLENDGTREFLQAPVAAIQGILRIVIMVFVGVLAGRFGVVPKDLTRALNALVSTVFLPCLLLSQVAGSASAQKILSWWPLPAFAILYVTVGAFLGWLLAKGIARHDNQLSRFIACSIAFQNDASIPLSMIQTLSLSGFSLLRDTSVGFALEGDLPRRDFVTDTPAAIVERGTAYILVYTLFTTILRWTVGYAMLDPQGSEPPRLQAAEANGAQNRLTWRQRLRKALRTPPVIAALLSLLIGLLSPVKEVFFDPTSPLEHTLTDAIRSFGAATVPSILLVLGVSLSDGAPSLAKKHKISSTRPADRHRDTSDDDCEQSSTNNNGPGLTAWDLSMIVIGRFIIMPAVASFVIIGLRFAGVLPADPVMTFVLLLASALPTSVNLKILCALHRSHERRITTVLFYEYMIAALPLAIWVSIFLYLIA